MEVMISECNVDIYTLTENSAPLKQGGRVTDLSLGF